MAGDKVGVKRRVVLGTMGRFARGGGMNNKPGWSVSQQHLYDGGTAAWKTMLGLCWKAVMVQKAGNRCAVCVGCEC